MDAWVTPNPNSVDVKVVGGRCMKPNSGNIYSFIFPPKVDIR
jgi:hypothetical protein